MYELFRVDYPFFHEKSVPVIGHSVKQHEINKLNGCSVILRHDVDGEKCVAVELAKMSIFCMGSSSMQHKLWLSEANSALMWTHNFEIWYE